VQVSISVKGPGDTKTAASSAVAAADKDRATATPGASSTSDAPSATTTPSKSAAAAASIKAGFAATSGSAGAALSAVGGSIAALGSAISGTRGGEEQSAEEQQLAELMGDLKADSLLLMPPMVRRELKWLSISAYQADGLPDFQDFGVHGINAFIEAGVSFFSITART
jgi:hypothetical protein